MSIRTFPPPFQVPGLPGPSIPGSSSAADDLSNGASNGATASVSQDIFDLYEKLDKEDDEYAELKREPSKLLTLSQREGVLRHHHPAMQGR